MRRKLLAAAATLTLIGAAVPAEAQYAVGHRTFGAGTSFGGGFTHMDFNFPGVDPDDPFLLLPTIELKAFLGDNLSIDVSIPVVNIAASSALQDYFFVTGDAFLNFHPSAPSAVELFIAPGIGFSYAKWEGEDEFAGEEQSGWAVHGSARIGIEMNSARRGFSVFLALRPFFAVAGSSTQTDGTQTEIGGGAFVELGLMAYSTSYRADRY